MSVAGTTWSLTEMWNGQKKKPQYDVTFKSDGTVTLNPSDGFSMVWFNAAPADVGISLAGDSCGAQGSPRTLVVWRGVVVPGTSITGTMNGTFNGEPVFGTWSAVPAGQANTAGAGEAV